MTEHKQGIYEKYIKRLFDIMLSLCAIIVLSPVMLILIVFGSVALKGNPFFTQVRIGKNGTPFKIVKFRTMTNKKDENGKLLPNEQRMTRYGRILRKTSLDELGEVFNILKGDMSIVGPRPLLEKYLPYYTEKEIHRHDVRPGLTGLAQIRGRSFISWEEIFDYDLEYLKKISLREDILILLQTVVKVIARENIADVSEGYVDDKGRRHFIMNGKDCILHQSLDIERDKYVK